MEYKRYLCKYCNKEVDVNKQNIGLSQNNGCWHIECKAIKTFSIENPNLIIMSMKKEDYEKMLIIDKKELKIHNN